MSLFPGVATKSPYLLEFRAGRMKRDGKMVSPDTRKGLVAVHQADDSLLHFIWKDRKTNRADDDSDLIIFPEEAELKKVKQTPQRVYQLVFKGSNKRFFFWMQEPKDDKDAELCRKVNWLLNNPPVPGASGDPFAGMSMDYANGAMDEDKKEAEAGDADKPAETTNASASAAPAGTQAAATPAELALLQQFLKNIKMPDNVDLQHVLSPDAIAPLLDSDETLERLKPFLPPPHTTAAVNQLVKSPQFAQAVQAFNAALKSGDVSTQALGVESDAQTVAGVEAFLKALQKEVDSKSAGSDEPAADTDKMEE